MLYATWHKGDDDDSLYQQGAKYKVQGGPFLSEKVREVGKKERPLEQDLCATEEKKNKVYLGS